jgi:hypothetical protein
MIYEFISELKIKLQDFINLSKKLKNIDLVDELFDS